jgi:hypothetical protein
VDFRAVGKATKLCHDISRRTYTKGGVVVEELSEKVVERDCLVGESVGFLPCRAVGVLVIELCVGSQGTATGLNFNGFESFENLR